MPNRDSKVAISVRQKFEDKIFEVKQKPRNPRKLKILKFSGYTVAISQQNIASYVATSSLPRQNVARGSSHRWLGFFR